LTTSIVAALAVGRWTDRHGGPFAALSVVSIVAAAGLAAMALADSPAEAKLAYFVFAAAGATFLAQHASQTLASSWCLRCSRSARPLFSLPSRAIYEPAADQQPAYVCCRGNRRQ